MADGFHVLLSLEVVLSAGPRLSVNQHVTGVEVGKLVVRILPVVELDLLLLFHGVNGLQGTNSTV